MDRFLGGLRNDNLRSFRASNLERGHLAGARDWSHQYGSADNTSTSLDERVRGELEVAWWGDPGPRPMPDRGPRNPAPLSANGRLYIQGDRILCGLDAYNGSVLWSVIAPEVRRANLPRDCSNTAADDTTLYVAHHEYCIEFDGQSGERRRRHAVPWQSGEPGFDWGYLAVVDRHQSRAAIECPGTNLFHRIGNGDLAIVACIVYRTSCTRTPDLMGTC